MTNRRPLTLLVIAALLPLVALSAALGAAALRQQQRAMEREALDQITRISALVSRELTAQLEILQAFAGSPLFDGVPDEAAFTDWSQRLLREHALWRTVSLSDRDGNRLFDVPELIGGIKGGKVVEADSHRRSVETLRPVIGGVRVGSRSKSAFAIRAPVIPSGQVAYVVSAIVFPDAIQDLLFASGLPAAWLGAVLDTDGRLAASTAGPSASIGQPAPQLSELRRRDDGPYHGISFEGENMETLYRADAATGWAGQVGIPDKIFRAPLVRSMWLIASGAAISLALAAAFLWLLSREGQLRRRTAGTAEQARPREALGRSTGGVAHEFNNLLTVVVGNLGLAIELAKADPELTRYLDRAFRGADRGSRITRQLLA